MMHLNICAGGFSIRLRSSDRKVIDRVRLLYADSVCNQAHQFTVTLEVRERFDVSGPRVKLCGGLNGSVDISRSSALFVIPSDSEYLIKGIFEICFTLICASRNALFLHSAGIVIDGRSVIFHGTMGAGKTTVARLSRHCRLLSDEHIIVKKGGAGCHTAYSTHIGGEYFKTRKNLKPNVRSAPVKAIIFLHKSGKDALVRKTAADAAAEILKESFFSFGASPELVSLKKKHLDSVAALVTDVDCYDLYFTKSQRFWKKINAVL